MRSACRVRKRVEEIIGWLVWLMRKKKIENCTKKKNKTPMSIKIAWRNCWNEIAILQIGDWRLETIEI
jgi:hypothetical protein